MIELLVVISIIGLLSTLAVVSLNNARMKSRDSKRVADMKQAQTALEMFYNDCNTYPVVAAAAVLASTMGTTNCNGAGTTVALSKYMATVPTAPTPHDSAACIAATDANRLYYYTSVDDTGAACTTYPCAGFKITYCLGATTGQLGAGLHTASQTGM